MATPVRRCRDRAVRWLYLLFFSSGSGVPRALSQGRSSAIPDYRYRIWPFAVMSSSVPCLDEHP